MPTFQESFASGAFGNKPSFLPTPGASTILGGEIQTIQGLNVSGTESTVKKLATQEAPQKKTEYTITDLTSSYQKALESGQFEGQTNKEIFNGILNSYKSKGYTVQGYDIDKELGLKTEEVIETPEVKDEGIIDKIGGGIDNIIGGGISQLPKIVSNLGGFFIGKPVDAILEKVGIDAPSLEAQFEKDGLRTKANFQDKLGVDPDAFTTSMGEFGAEVGVLFIPGGQEKLIEKFPQASEKIAQLGNYIEKLSKYAPKTFNLLKTSLTGAKEMAKFGLVSEGDITKEDVAIGAVGAPIISGIAKGAKTLGGKIYTSAFRPSKQEASAIIDDLAGRYTRKATVAETAFKKQITGTKTSVGVKGVKSADKLWKTKVNPLLEQSTQTVNKNNAFAELKKGIDATVEPGRKADLTKAYTKLTQEYKNEPIEWSMKNAQDIKSGLDKFTPKKAFKGEDIAQSYKELKSQLANYIRNDLHTKLSTEFGTDTAKAYMEWANLNKLRSIGIQGVQTGGEGALQSPSGFGTLIANLYTSLMTPIKTKGGVSLYRVGNLAELTAPTGLKTFKEYLNYIDKGQQ